MKTILLIISMALSCLALPAQAQSATATMTTCITGQLLCNKACGKGPSAVPCVNTCGMKAQMCASNNGRWPGADSSSDDDDDRPAKSSSRRKQKAAEPEDDEEEASRASKSSSSSRNGRSDGKCTTDAEFVHSWPVDKSNDEFKFKFRVSSDDCNKYGCTGWVNYRIHFNYQGGNSGKTTLVRYRIPEGQRSTEVTAKNFPFVVGTKIDVRDVEIKEVSCSSP